MKTAFENIDLKHYNSFGVSVLARHLVEVDSVESLRKLFLQDGFLSSMWNILGGGNNIIFSGDYTGTLIKPTMSEIQVVQQSEQNVYIKVGAGVEWDDLVAWTVERGFWGGQNLSLIPGKVGASPVQNIGAYGVEAKDIIDSVEVYYPHSDTTATLSATECEFGYRESVFKNSLRERAIITSVNFLFTTTPNPKLGYGDLKDEVEKLGGATLANIRQAVINIRSSKLPDPKVTGNAGSFFKNPIVEHSIAEKLQILYPDMPIYPTEGGGSKLAAGWLIDRAGWRGYVGDRVGVHPKQALVLINLGGASGQDIIELADRIRTSVKELFGVEIEMEVNIL